MLSKDLIWDSVKISSSLQWLQVYGLLTSILSIFMQALTVKPNLAQFSLLAQHCDTASLIFYSINQVPIF